MIRGLLPCILRDELPTLDDPPLEAFTFGASGLRDVALTRDPAVRTGRAAISLRVRTPGAVFTDGEAAVRTVEREDVGRDDEYERLRIPVELDEPL